MELFMFIISLNFILNFPESKGYGLLIHHPPENIVSFLNNYEPEDILQKLTLANFNKLCKLLEKPQHIFRSDTFNQGNPIQLICRQCNFNGILLQLFYDNEHHEMLIPSMWYQGDTLYYITQFKNYDKYIVFWENPSNNNDSRYLDMAVLTDYLPLKNTGIAAIKFIENLQPMNFERQTDILRICASLFMNLQFMKVESRNSYYIKSVRIGNEEKCICFKSKHEREDLRTILAYSFFLGLEDSTTKILILKRHSLTGKFTTSMAFSKNILL